LYLTFLPHSGFHNQRIALENAIFLSWFLDRTLVMPPYLLGIRRPFRRLEKNLTELRSEPAEIVCKDSKPKYESSCIRFHDSYTFYQWDNLFNFSIVAEYNIKILPVSDYSDKKLFNILNINDPLNQVYKSFKYHTNHSFYDSDTLDAKVLKKNPHKDFESNLMPNNKIMLEVVDKIVDNLGGFLNFISIHARNRDVTKDSNLITPLIEALPCSYMLLDFDPLLEPYRTLVNPIDNKILHKFLLPLTDLMVAARASNIYSMHASTFGRYLNACHLFLNKNID
ncbi:20585_t:CDS:2, partial [Entrophospora sp. SA101]